MLGSTMAGASIASQLGVPYAFAGHFAMGQAREAIAHYRERFEPSRRLAAPYAMCAITVICGASDEEAERLAAPARVTIINSRTGKRAPIPTVEEALAHSLSPQERAIADDFLTGAVIGSPARVTARLPEVAREIGADELMLSVLIASPEGRRFALESIAAARL
jgi:luciferase family oxidoreductase group 1